MRKVFISHTRANERDIDQLAKHLAALGWQVWNDTSAAGAEAWWQEVLDLIADCDTFIPIISREALSSMACARELDWAEALGKPVLPVAVEPPPNALPRRFARRQIIDYSDPGDRDRAALRLAQGLVALPQAPPLPDPLPTRPAAPLSYLTALLDLVSQPNNLDHEQQRKILVQLGPALRSVDAEERRGGRAVLRRFSTRDDLYTDVDRLILSLGSPTSSTPRKSGSGIFISYRRGNENFFVRLLYDNLSNRFGRGQVFVDVDSIDLGVDFAKVIDQQLSQCSVMLVVIGKDWTKVAGSDGRPRLEEPNDFVRIEVEKALSRDDVRVIPVCVDGASPPRAIELPASLAALSQRNGLAISHEAFKSDLGRLLETLERVISYDPDQQEGER